jgi:anaerobic selenocysteine-containing dehydrogenase
MHPHDLAARGLSDGARVLVRSRVGEISAPLAACEDIMPGVVSLPHGWGHARPDTALSVAQQRPGVSLNDLTDELLIDPVAGTSVLSGIPVDVIAAPERARATTQEQT